MPSLAALSSFLSVALRRQGPRLLLPLLALALPSLRAATSGNFEYTDTGTAITITKYTGNEQVVAIPGTIASKPVTVIRDSTFVNCFSLTGVTIPASVTSITGSAIWGCSDITSIDVATGNLTYASLDGVLFTKNLKALIRYPQNKAQTSFAVPASVTSIGADAFTNCRRLTSITIPAGVTSIGDSAFQGCSGLTSMIIPEGVTTIGDSAFFDCSGLTSIDIPDSVTSIAGFTFSGCKGLTSITIPNHVTSIGVNAFQDCWSLTSANIPASVTSIGGAVFARCHALTNITIPASITSIEGDAFSNCRSLTTITIPESVTYIGGYAFGGCSGLTTITIPESVTSIPYKAFFDCSGLISITIPPKVTSIGNGAFSGCSGLTSITIPASVTSIGFGAFRNCSGLTRITIPASIASIDEDTFFGCNGLTTITIPASVTGIGHGAFSGCSGLTTIIIPDSVTAIGGAAFRDCYRLTTIAIPASVTSIEDYAFADCSGLTSVTIPVGVTSIGDHTFYNCIRLTTITIPASVASIGLTAFSNCSGLTNIEVATGNLNYASVDGVLYTNALKTLMLYPQNKVQASFAVPSNVTSIGGSAFRGCNNLTSITIPASVTSIPDSAFYLCSSLTTITIPRSVTSIGDSAFRDCSSLSRITIPDSVTSIRNSTFYNCSSLSSITIPDSVTSIEGSAFYKCNSLSSIIIPDSVTSIQNNAFTGCGKLSAALFLGNAPQAFGYSVFSSTAPSFTIYYTANATGFTSPTWNGYKAQALPVIATQPQSQTVVAGTPTALVVDAAGTDLTYQWFKGGAVVAGATAATLDFASVNSANAGLYDAVVTGTGGEALTRPIVVGVVPAAGERTAGAVSTRPEWQDIRHPVTGSIYDQYLLTGPAGTFTAAAGKIARMSYLDTNDSIVQVEMSGAGAITVVLDGATGPIAPSLYNQSGIAYMKGKATIILAGADATSHFTIYSVGTATNPGVTRAGTAYNGWADVAAAGISSTDGKLGGIHQGNVSYNAALGYTGIYAPTVTAVGGLVVVHGIAASADAIPYLYFGTGGLVKVKIAGTALAQPNTDSLIVGGLAEVRMGAGQDSCGLAAPAAAIATRLVDDAENDRTTALVVGP